MRRVERPPITDATDLLKILNDFQHPDVAGFIEETNRRYLHWDEFRRRPQPLGLPPKSVYAAVVISRSQRTPLPLADVAGEPFSFWLPNQAQQWIHYVDRNAGMAPDRKAEEIERIRDRVIVDSLMEEAIASSQLEGAATTRKVAKEMLRSGRPPRDRSEQMIVNGFRTMAMLRDRINEPLTLELLHDMQESITRETLDDPRDARRIRSPQDNIRVVDRDEEDVYVPPPADQLPERLQRLIDFANHSPDEPPFIYPIIRASVLHFWLAYEHPYADGNGRTARALLYWYMLKRRYDAFEYLSISRVIQASPMKYYRAFLYSENDTNDLTYFLMFQLDVTCRAIEQLRMQLKDIRDEQQRMGKIRLASDLNERQRALIDHALRHPSKLYTIEWQQHFQRVSNETARADLLQLADRGYLREVGKKRPREFMAAPDLPAQLGIDAPVPGND